MISSAKWFLLFLVAFLGALFLLNATPAKAQTTVLSATLTVAEPTTGELGCNVTASSLAGRCSPSTGSGTTALTDYDFTYSGTDYLVRNLYLTGTLLVFGIQTGTDIRGLNTLVLQLGSDEFAIAESVSEPRTSWSNAGLTWSVGDSVSVKLIEPPPPTVSLSVSPNPVWEGSSVTVTAQLSRALASQVMIPVTLTDNSAESTDHGTLASITIASGATSGTGMISTNHDTDEDDETFTVALGTLPSSVTAGTPSLVQITILDDEGIPTVSLSASPNPVPEGESVRVTATLSEALSGLVEIPLRPAWNTGTVETGDIKGPPGTITVFHGKETGETLVLAVKDCDTDDEMFTVALDTARLPSSLRAGTPSSVTITIEDDSVPCTPPTNQPTDQPPPNTGGTGTGGGGSGTTPPALSSDASLNTLEIKEASLDFDPGTDTYTVNVYGVTIVTLTPTANHPDAEITVNGNTVQRGSSAIVALDDDGETSIEIEVTAEDGNTRTYTLTVMYCPGEEREILKMFYVLTEGDMWEENKGWNTEDSLRNWHGVETENGNITVLSLPDNRLSSGEVPEALRCFGGLEELLELDLSDNSDLGGELPRGLSELNNLGVLDISCTGIDVSGETEEWALSLGEGFRSGCDTQPDDMVSTSGDGGCAVGASQKRLGASALLALIFMLLAVSRGLRACSD